MAVFSGLEALVAKGNGTGDKAELSILEVKVLANLRSSWLGISATATAMNPTDAGNAGSHIYRTSEIIQIKDYLVKTNQADDVTIDSIRVDINTMKTLSYEIETFDQASIVNMDQLANQIASSLSLSIMAYLDGVFIKTAVEEAIAYATATGETNQVVNANFSTGRTEDQLRTNWFDVVDTTGDLIGRVDKKYIGVNKSEVNMLTSHKALQRFIKEQGNYTEPAVNASATGEMTIRQVGGVGVAEHTFFGREIPAGTSFDANTTYNFSKLEAVVFHGEAIAMPFALNTITQVITQEDGNPRWIAKIKHGAKAVRPELLKLIVNALMVAGDVTTPSVTLLKTLQDQGMEFSDAQLATFKEVEVLREKAKKAKK